MGAPPPSYNFGGQLIAGRYQLQGREGHGRQGVLYRGTDQRGGDTVAVRLTSSPPDAARFETLRGILHPRVARILDAGVEDGQDFVVAEWLDGFFLDHEMETNPLGSARILSLMVAVCEGLAAMHAAGVAHGAFSARSVCVRRPQSPLMLAGSDVKLSDPLLHGEATVAGDLTDCRDLLTALIRDGAVEPVKALARRSFADVAELGAACSAALAALTVEEMNTVATRPAPEPQPPMPQNIPMPTNWSPPPPRPLFVYNTVGPDGPLGPVGNPMPPPGWNTTRPSPDRRVLYAVVAIATALIALWLFR